MIIGFTGTRKDEKRFLAKVRKTQGCWLWLAAKNENGYGKFSVGGRAGTMVQAHRWAYERWVGPIPDGLTVDHVCHNDDLACSGGKSCPHRACVRPDHLRVTTLVNNAAAGRGGGGVAQRAKTHCPKGHPYDTANTYVKPNGRRCCRTCRSEQSVIDNEKRKAAGYWEKRYAKMKEES